MTPLILLLVSIGCAVVEARSFSVSECPKNAVGACMTGIVQKRSNDVGFCQEAATALDCATVVLRDCYPRNDPGFLEALSSYDIVGLHQKWLTLCED